MLTVNVYTLYLNLFIYCSLMYAQEDKRVYIASVL